MPDTVLDIRRENDRKPGKSDREPGQTETTPTSRPSRDLRIAARIVDVSGVGELDELDILE